LKGNQAVKDSKPLPAPKKFVTFSPHDSHSIENEYQKLAEEEEEHGPASGRKRENSSPGENTSINEAGNKDQAGPVQVAVHEDFLFDVDIERRELAPVYWLGPIYEVRRGTWFFQEGSVLRPCEENLAAQLEEGYLKIKPFRYPKAPLRSPSTARPPKPGEGSLALSGVFGNRRAGTSSAEVTPKSSVDNLRASAQQSSGGTSANTAGDASPPSPHQPQSHRLFGTYMNSIVTYQDATVAWLSTDNIMSRMSNTVYQRFAGGGYLGGVKIVRGYTEPSKTKETKDAKLEVEKRPPTPTTAKAISSPDQRLQLDEKQQKLLKRRSAPPGTTLSYKDTSVDRPAIEDASVDSLETAMSSLEDPEKQREAAIQRDEKEIQNDYRDDDAEDQNREIEHVILVTHGIGQRLGMRTESVNFVHDVNVLRQTLKSVYKTSADLQALNSEIDKLPKNCRVQVLPVCWRHLLDFPKQGVRQNRKEHDLGDIFGEEEEYPSLEDITVEGVPFVRSLITDLALDILLYQSAYREHISGIVLRECNRIFKLFLDRNPYFNGKVSLVGHSLGSAILFDILCRQKDDIRIHGSARHQKYYHNRPGVHTKKKDGKDLSFDFEVEDFYALGSPIGLFQMLKGRTIAARFQPDALPADSPMNPEYMDDPFLAASASGTRGNTERDTILQYAISSPKCARFYNIFHPSDPISYRIEPLISPAMASLKPQHLPYTKKGIFGSSASQGLTGIGARVGQSVSGIWSSLSSGIASSLLNRSLGLTGEDVASMANPSANIQTHSLSAGAGTNITSGGVIADNPPPLIREDTNEKKRQLAEDTAAADKHGTGNKASTLIDGEIETLYAGFQKRRKSQQDVGEGLEWAEAEERARKLRREEMKVRALNSNGRVDFSIQE
jgi:hypothetical protein